MIRQLFSKDASSNTYLVSGDMLVVIDPGFQSNRVLDEIRSLHYTHYALINTHCHFDHVAENSIILEEGFELQIHDLDAVFIENGAEEVLHNLFGQSFDPLDVSRRLSDGDIIDLDGVVLEVVHTPGHTPGSICLYEPDSKSLFTGDTLFVGGVGRTDLIGGNGMELIKSLSKLRDFADSRGVEKYFPGHGPDGDLEELLRMCDLYGKSGFI